MTEQTSMASKFCGCHPDDPVCLTIWKSADATNEDRFIEGLASVDIRDTEGEIVHPDKLDFTYLDKGMAKINWIHKSDPDDQIGNIVGYKVGLVKDIVPKQYHDRVHGFLNNIGVWIRAKLKRGLKKAESVWTDMTSNPMDHGLGFSLQGSAQRKGTDVIGGMVTNAALTPNPVLAETFAVLAKALGTSYARSGQTGFQSFVPEDLRDEVISTSVGSSRYGSRPPGGWAFRADALIGHRRGRDGDRKRTTEPMRQSFLMPAGEPVKLTIDIDAATRALKSFLEYVRSKGPEKGNVLDDSSDYFQLCGLDRHTAHALARYVRENANKLFQKAFPPNVIEEWREREYPRSRIAPVFDDPSEEQFRAIDEEPSTTLSKDFRELSDLVDRLEHDRINEQLQKHSQRRGRAVYELSKGEDGNMSNTALQELEEFLAREDRLAKSVGSVEDEDAAQQCKQCFAPIDANMNFCPMCAHTIKKSKTEEDSVEDLLQYHHYLLNGFVSTDMTIAIRSGELTKSQAVELIRNKQPRLEASNRLEKSKTFLPMYAQTFQRTEDTPEIVQEYQYLLLSGHVSSDMVTAIRSGQLSRNQAVQSIKYSR